MLIGVLAVTIGLGILFGSGLADRTLHFTGQQTTGYWDLSGHVVDYCTGLPIQGALVEVTTGDYLSGITDATGDYNTDSIGESVPQYVRASKTGYQTVTITKSLYTNQINVQDFALIASGFGSSCPPADPPGPGNSMNPPPPGAIGGNVTDPTTDFDGDLVADGTDNCPVTPNPTQADLDGNGIGDACEPAGSRILDLVAFLVLLIVILLGGVLIIVGLMR